MKTTKIIHILFAGLAIWLLLPPAVTAQKEVPADTTRFALKTNALHWATASFNLSGEMAVGKQSSLELYWGWNPFDRNNNRKWKHWIVQPAYRRWITERFHGSFVGVHLHGGKFNVGHVGPFTTLKENRYEGYFYGAGVSYGYRWRLSQRVAFEAEIGMGYARLEYDKFGCTECAPKIKSGHTNYFGPTRAALSFVVNIW